MLTRQQGQLALIHVLENLFHFTDANPLWKGLHEHGYLDIRDVIAMDPHSIDTLTYANADNDVDVPAPARTLLHVLKGYHAYRYAEASPIGDNWTSITAEEFDEYRVTEYNVATLTAWH